jgi:two-component system, OmpR family, sensor histidine kinase ArlS
MKKYNRRIPKLSAATRLALRFSLLITSIVFVVSSTLLFLLKTSIRTQQSRELTVARERIADSLPELLQNENQDTDEMLLYDELPYYILFTIYQKTTGNILDTNDPYLPKLPEINGHTARYHRKHFYIDGDLSLLYSSKTYTTEGLGPCIVQTALTLDRDTSEQFITRLPRLLLILLLPLLAVSFWAAHLITARTLRPVQEMTRSARKISSAHLDSRLPVDGSGDELDTLAQTFNELFLRLKTDFDRERQFTSNVSHELRTPLAVILGQAGIIKRWAKNDPEQLEDSLTALIRESHTMESIISNLLQLSRLENGITIPSCKAVAVYPLLKQLAADTAVWSPAAVFSLPDAETNVCAVTDESLLCQVCTIIIANSIKFSGGPAHITITVQQTAGIVTLSFTDTGRGFSPDILPFVFERFFRGDPSHNRNAGGSGLGLSIARTIMTILGGSITAENAPGGGALLTLFLPAYS